MPPVAHSSPSELHHDKQKKPRHRHSPAQLAALNELFEKDEHPPLDLRVSLAERLGMETKTVNAWFQNKRASSKKRTVTRNVPDPDNIPSTPSTADTLPPNLHQPDYDYLNEEDYYPPFSHPQHQWPTPFYPDTAGGENDTMPRRMRIRPSLEQTEELRKLFNIYPHPPAEQRQALADRIGMRYQSVTNWFQNQRSIAKKKKDDEGFPDDNRTFSGFPPPTHYHPSLPPRQSASPAYHEPLSRRSNPRRSVTPYSSPMTSRPRRSRPEPHQLAALNDMYCKNAHPSIEQRTALALEIGMDLGKVTNWFRNLRQTRRRHARKAGSGDDDDYYHHSGSPTPSTCSEDYPQTEDELEEALTPRSESSPSPPTYTLPLPPLSLKALSLAAAYTPEIEHGIKVEDALLLLTFHRQDVRI